jgi:hypothetical protein
MMEDFNQDDGKNHPDQVFDTHMDFLTLALFVWDFPSRKEKFEFQFENKTKNWKPTEVGNFVNVSNDTERVIILILRRRNINLFILNCNLVQVSQY